MRLVLAAPFLAFGTIFAAIGACFLAIAGKIAPTEIDEGLQGL